MPSSTAETFRLYLVRHARAGWSAPGTSDFDRPLDEGGRLEAADVAEQAAVAGLVPDLLVSSPARRCRETSALLLKVFRSAKRSEDMLLYSGDTDAYLARIRQESGSGSMMIVGHNPMIEALAHHLSRRSAMLAPLVGGYPTAGLLALDFALPLSGDLAHAGDPVALITPALT